MATYAQQYTSGSATSTADQGNAAMGIVNASGVDATAINPSALAYGFYSVDASGRVFADLDRVTYSNAASRQQMILVAGFDPDDGKVYNLPLTPAGRSIFVTLSATGNAPAVVPVSGIIDSGAFVASAVSGFPAMGVVRSGSPSWGTDEMHPFRMTTDGEVFVSGQTLATATLASGTQQIGGVSAFISGTATMRPATATGVTADALGGADSQIAAAYTYIRTSGANTWDRWQSVLSGATASGVGVPMVADMWQFDDVGTITVGENFFGVPRMNANRIAYVTATAIWPVSAGSVFGVSGNLSAVTANQNGVIWGVTSSAVTAAIASGTVTLASGTQTIGTVTSVSSATTAQPVTRAAGFASGFSTAAVADAATALWYGTRTGIPFVIGGAPDVQTVWIQPTAVSSNAKLIDVTATGQKIIVLEAGVSLASTATTGVAFRMAFPSASGATGLDAVATSTAGNLTANQLILSHPNISPGGGTTRGNGAGIIAVGGDGYDVFATWTVPTNGSLDVWINYMRVPS